MAIISAVKYLNTKDNLIYLFIGRDIYDTVDKVSRMIKYDERRFIRAFVSSDNNSEAYKKFIKDVDIFIE